MSNFRTIDRQTGFLLPPAVDEWLPEKHLARFVVEGIEGLDLRAMSGSYRGSGSASYHPRMLLGILVYGYATDVLSSRKLARATYDSVAFRFIAANDHPDHDTIAAFRRRFLKEIDGMSIPDELARREERLRKIAEARAKIEARAKERHAREMAEHEAKFAAREAKTAATGKKPGGKPSGEALRAPALDPVSRWRVEEVRDLARQFTPVEQRVGAVYVREKLESVTRASHPLAAGMPGSLIIVGGGAAGNAAAETLRHEGYFGRITMLSADESMPCDRPNLSKGYLAGTASEESNLLRSAKFYREHEWRK